MTPTYMPLSSRESGVDSPLLLPTHSIPFSPPSESQIDHGRRWLYFFGGAVVSGILFYILFLGVGSTAVGGQRLPNVLDNRLPGGSKSTGNNVKAVYKGPNCLLPAGASNTTPPGPVHPLEQVIDEESPMTIDQLREMVSHTKGYYGRDYTLALGWNNVRYIAEAALLHARLFNRTLVLPSFVYARACEWEIHACAAFAPMVNRGDAVGWDTWRELPIEKQMAWRIPIGVMLDLNHLRRTHSVITVGEYLELNGMSPSIELSHGAWDREKYQNRGKVSIHVIPNNEYDPSPLVRVDRLPEHPAGQNISVISEQLYEKLGDSRIVMDLSEAASVVRRNAEFTGDEELEAILRENGWEVLHTFSGALGMEWNKSVVDPIKQVAPRYRLRGMVEDYNDIDTDVLVLAGETHVGRKPGGLRFTTVVERSIFANSVLHNMRPIGPVRRLAIKVHDRMEKIVEGRQWMGSHMRRGDFIKEGWVMDASIEKHLKRIKSRLTDGRAVLEKIHTGKDVQPYDVPEVKPEIDVYGRPPPRKGDPFYLATDERSTEGIKYVRAHGAVLIGDLITFEDRQEFGWPIMLTDVLAVLEQSVLSHSAYFYGHAMSSVAGGVVNMRAGRGADKRTVLID